MNSWYHARSSVAKWGGEPEDYLPIHEFIDQSKAAMGDVRHRAVLHHTIGTRIAEQVFGTVITASTGRQVPVREVAERHIIEDLGFLPTPQDWLRCVSLKAIPWAGGRADKLAAKGVPVSAEIVSKIKQQNKV